MSDDRKPSDDLRDGFGLLLRAARGAVREVAKEVDLAKAARTAGQVAESAGKEILRVANVFGQTFEREIGVRPKSAPPTSDGAATDADAKPTEGDFHAVEEPKKGEP